MRKKSLKNNRINSITKKIISFLQPEKDVKFAFIFGSLASGHMTSSSDLDIAILFNHTPDFNTINELKDALVAALNKEIDLIPLNNASPILKMQILKKGVLIINNNNKAYDDFIIRTVNEYDDLKRIRNEIEMNILKGRIYQRKF